MRALFAAMSDDVRAAPGEVEVTGLPPDEEAKVSSVFVHPTPFMVR